MDVRSIPLTANVPARQSIPFRFFMLISAPSALQVSFLSVGSLSKIGEVGRDVEAGYKKFPLDPADPAERWGGYELLSTVNQTVRVGVSDSAGDYERLVQLFQLEAADELASAADVATSTAAEVEVVASNANRKQVHIGNLDSTNAVRLRESLGAATVQGQRLEAGLTLTLQTTAAIYAVAEAGTPSLSVLEEQKA